MVMGRPEKPIDWKKVDQLLIAGCSGTEIAPHFDMHYNTFYNKVQEQYKMGFSEYSALKKEQGDSLLKAKQFEKAMSGDNSMLIWLGKNRLKQKDNHEFTDRELHVHYSTDSAAHKDGQIQAKTISEKDSIRT